MSLLGFNMNYQKIYDALIMAAPIDLDYNEVHHITPKCLGGSDDPSNLVILSARAHFIAHLLLAKIHPSSGLVHAANMMSNMKRYGSRKYAWLRVAHAARMSERYKGMVPQMTAARAAAYSDPKRNMKISESLKKHTRTPEHNKAIGDAQRGKPKWQEEDKLKFSLMFSGENNPNFGKTHSEESRRRISEANRKKTICPHCAKEGGIAIMKRWHFDNCKENQNVLSE